MDTGVSGWSLSCYLCILCIFSEVSIKAHTHTAGEEMWCLAVTGHRRTHSQFSFSGCFPSSIGWSDRIRSDSFPFKDSTSDTQLPALAGSPSSLHLPSRPRMFAPSLSFISRSSHPYSKHLHTLWTEGRDEWRCWKSADNPEEISFSCTSTTKGGKPVCVCVCVEGRIVPWP